MFKVSDLEGKYDYTHTANAKRSKKSLDKKNANEVTEFINLIIRVNDWKWNNITYFSCKKTEYLLQEKLPSEVTDKQEIYFWLVTHWKMFGYPPAENSSRKYG